jgi:hypothetical protein
MAMRARKALSEECEPLIHLTEQQLAFKPETFVNTTSKKVSGQLPGLCCFLSQCWSSATCLAGIGIDPCGRYFADETPGSPKLPPLCFQILFRRDFKASFTET